MFVRRLLRRGNTRVRAESCWDGWEMDTFQGAVSSPVVRALVHILARAQVASWHKGQAAFSCALRNFKQFQATPIDECGNKPNMRAAPNLASWWQEPDRKWIEGGKTRCSQLTIRGCASPPCILLVYATSIKRLRTTRSCQMSMEIASAPREQIPHDASIGCWI